MTETGRYKIYFRLRPFKYFLGKDLYTHKYIIMKKEWDKSWGHYRWKEI